MERPAVSVIIPVWNSGKYFRECLDSVISQSLRNIEVLIVDDASTDGSGAVADEYASRDARITVMHQTESTGPGAARNTAIAVARGEYIAFMDSDDLYPSRDILAMLYYRAVEQKANICGGSLQYITGDKIPMIKQHSQQIFTQERWYDYKEYQYDGGFYRFIYNRLFIGVNNLLFPCRTRFEDPIFFVNAMLKAEKFYAVSYITYAYRKGHKENNWSLKASMQHVQGVRELLYISRRYSLEDLHWLMAKNFMESLCRRMDEGGVWLKLKLFFDVAWEIDWRCVHKRNLGKVPQLSFGKIFCRGILIPEIRKAIDSLQYIAKRVSSIINRLLES